MLARHIGMDQEEEALALIRDPAYDVNNSEFYDETPLHAAANTEMPAVMAALLARPDIEVNKPSGPLRTTPLMRAVQSQLLPHVEALLGHPEIDVNRVAFNDAREEPVTALDLAWNMGPGDDTRYEIRRKLEEKGAIRALEMFPDQMLEEAAEELQRRLGLAPDEEEGMGQIPVPPPRAEGARDPEEDAEARIGDVPKGGRRKSRRARKGGRRTRRVR